MARNLFLDDPVEEIQPGVNLFSETPVQEPPAGEFVPQAFTPREKDPQSFAAGAGQSLLQGATLGFADEIQSVIAATVSAPFVSDKTFGQLMMDARASFREEQERFREEHPKTALGLEVAGGLVTGGAGVGRSVAGQTLKQATVRGVGAGTAIGTVAGAGFADEESFFSQETLEEAVKTGAISGLLGGLTPTIIKGAVTAGKLVPKALPESLLQTAMKFRPSIDQAARAKMTRTALDEGIMPTVRGLETISKKLTNLDVGLNNIIDEATEKGMLIPKKALFTELTKLRKDLGGVNIRAAKNIKQIDNIASEFDKQLKLINKKRLTPREVQDLKRSAYQQLKFDVTQQSAKFAETEAEKGIIRGAKKSLEKISPDVEAINLREGALLQLGDELERVVGRLDNRNLISLDTAVKIGAGAATGTPTGAVVGTGAAILGAPRIKAKTALILENIRTLSDAMEGAKNMSPELLSAFSIMVEDQNELLNEMIDDQSSSD